MHIKIFFAVLLLLGAAAPLAPIDTLIEGSLTRPVAIHNLIDDASSPTQLVTPDDSDRGCCVLLANPVQCAYANRGYCRKLATEKSIQFEFYKDIQCRNVAQCPVNN